LSAFIAQKNIFVHSFHTGSDNPCERCVDKKIFSSTKPNASDGSDVVNRISGNLLLASIASDDYFRRARFREDESGLKVALSSRRHADAGQTASGKLD
jgi:hypothetical protein